MEHEEYTPLTEDECIEWNQALNRELMKKIVIPAVAGISSAMVAEKIARHRRLLNIQSNH